LLEHTICGVAGLDIVVNREVLHRNGAVPDIVIAAAAPHEAAARGLE
jgi:hypothetical protein